MQVNLYLYQIYFLMKHNNLKRCQKALIVQKIRKMSIRVIPICGKYQKSGISNKITFNITQETYSLLFILYELIQVPYDLHQVQL